MDAKTEDGKQEHRGIPKAIFYEDVKSYVKKNNGPVEAMKTLNNLYGKYKFMESSLLGQKKGLVQKIADIEKALGGINYLVEHREDDEISLHFELASAVHAEAAIKPSDSVFLWLGANVMLEYTYDEAQALLSKNLESAQTQIKSVTEDIAFLKEQITVSEVNIARVHNVKVAMEKETKNKSEN